MPQSLHRLFFHLHEVAEACPVSIGEASEEAIETSHKGIKKAINHHSRQFSYEAMNKDVGRYRLLETDPKLNDISKKYKSNYHAKRKPIPKGVLDLLKPHNPVSYIEEPAPLEEDDFLVMPDIDIESFINDSS